METLLIMFIAFSVLLIGIAIPLRLGKIGPNGLYGFRIKKTIENPEIWYPVNRYSSNWLMAAGILEIIAALGLYFVPGIRLEVFSLSCLAVFVLVFFMGLVATLRYMNSLDG